MELGAAIELFHAFALIHDDVMDGSATRRHQPTVHHRFAALHGEAGWRGESRRTAEGFAILLGDLAFAWSSHLLVALPAPVAAPSTRCASSCTWASTWTCSAPPPATRTPPPPPTWSASRPPPTRCSARCSSAPPWPPAGDGTDGARLDGEPLDRCWTAYGLAVGEAFQHRDDLLGVFGDTAVTGKPVGDDLQAGKNTLLLQRTLAAAGAGSLEVLGRIGSGELRPQDIEVIGTFMRDCGAVDAVERRIARLVCEAVAAVEAAPLEPEAADGLCSLARAAAWRAQ
ncbi:MAG: polyprenyl synthetase family protein [Acidimicrobiales bacterium]